MAAPGSRLPRLLELPSTQWRFMAISTLRKPWVVQRARFFTDEACTQEVTDVNDTWASGSSGGNLPGNVLRADNSTWDSGCAPECCGANFGVEFRTPKLLRCVHLDYQAGASWDSLPGVAVQLLSSSHWRHVATMPAEGGALQWWDPQAVGALCQGISPVNPELRGGGSLFLLHTTGVTHESWAVQDLVLFSDEACTRPITHVGIPSESVWWKGSWKPMETPTNATEAFDGLTGTTWKAEFNGKFFEGGSGEDAPSIGAVLPLGFEVRCLLVESPKPLPLRLLRCEGETWQGVDNCVCLSAWSDSTGPLYVAGYFNSDFRAIGVICFALLLVFLCVAPGLAAGFANMGRQLWEMLSRCFDRSGGDDGDSSPGTPQSNTAWESVVRAEELGEVPPVHELFRRHAKAAPAAPCVRRGLGTPDISYGDLARRVDALASTLRSRLEKQSVVGLLLDRQPSMVVAILAALEAECIWVPLDEFAPPDRQRGILQDADTRMLLINDGDRWDLGLPCVALTAEGAVASTPPASAPSPPRQTAPPPGDTACFYYTSGSTGEPKAVVMDHRFFVVNARWYVDCFGVAPGDVVAAKARFIWATALWEILPPIICGATLLLLPKLKTEEIARRLADGGATHYCGVPSELELCMEPGLPLKHLICMGERLLPQIAANLLERIPRGCTLWNAYAATESPVALWAVTKGAERILAGRPLPGSFIAILDDAGAPAAVGAVGEVIMGGVIPRIGYWRRPELTAERFFQSCVGRAFRSGDMGRLVQGPGGLQLEVTGRRDRQVKIRGQRVELGEVEAVAIQLLASRGGTAAVVAATSDDGQQHMFLYAAPADVDAVSLRSDMAAKLPPYMLPDATRLVVLGEMPRLPNGKVNFMALKDMAAATMTGETLQALDSLGLARQYSQQQLAAKHCIETGSGFFLIGMLLFHSRWWTWGAHLIGPCPGCSPRWVSWLMQATVVNESCLFGFICGGALMATTQADCHTWSVRDFATLLIYLFMYFPWYFLLRGVEGFVPDLITSENVVYHRWYLLMVLEAKALLVLTRRYRLPPILVVAALLGAFIAFPPDGYIGPNWSCDPPTNLVAFFTCWAFAGAHPMVMSRKIVLSVALYYAVVHFGPRIAAIGGRVLGQPKSPSLQTLYCVAAFAGYVSAGAWFVHFCYPLEGYEIVEWPDSLVWVGFGRIDSAFAFGLLFLQISVPIVQVTFLFTAFYYAPGSRWKRTSAAWLSSTLLGTYLVSLNIRMKQWLTDVVLWICSCQCSAIAGVGHLVASLIFSVLIALTVGYLFQAFLLRVVVPALLGLGAAASSRTQSFALGGRGFRRMQEGDDGDGLTSSSSSSSDAE